MAVSQRLLNAEGFTPKDSFDRDAETLGSSRADIARIGLSIDRPRRPTRRAGQNSSITGIRTRGMSARPPLGCGNVVWGIAYGFVSIASGRDAISRILEGSPAFEQGLFSLGQNLGRFYLITREKAKK
jgi:hypothetical protein